MLATPKPAPATAAPPVFDQALIDEAMAEPMLQCGCTHSRGQRIYHAPVLLALVERLHPNSTSSSGASVAERLAAQLRQFLVINNMRFPGNQGTGTGWASAAATAIVVLARYTPTVWNLLSADEKNRSDWYMRLAAVVANTRNNEASQCQNSIGLDHSGGSNPNQRPDMRSMSYAWIYFGGADAVNAELAAFDYDTYLNKFQAFGWNANVEEWTKPNVRNMLEHGGSYTLCTVHPDGARHPFTQVRGRITGSNKACPGFGYAPDDKLLPFTPINMFRREEHDFLYGAEVVDQSCKKSPTTSPVCPDEFGRLLSGAPSPHLGEIGMFLEYNIGTRSGPVYSGEGAAMGIAHYAVLAALGFWDSGNPAYDEMEDRFWVAMDDARYKNAHGWFDNTKCKDTDFLDDFHGGRYLFGIWDTMFQNKSIVWAHNPVTGGGGGTTPDITTGLVGHWKLDETTGATVADSSGSGITGTITGNPVKGVAGKVGKALDFDGNGDYIDLGNPTALQLTGSMTLSAWVRGDAFQTENSFLSKRGSSTNLGWALKKEGSTFLFQIATSASAFAARASGATAAVGTWYHVVGVYNAAAKTMVIYINGVLDNGALTGTVPGSQRNSTVNVNIGRRPINSQYWNGVIDDVRIYNRALSASEVAALP